MSDSVALPGKRRSKLGRLLLYGLGSVLGLLLFNVAGPIVGSLVPSADRTLYFKLPIEGARFHWRFLDPEAFLAGELTLRIINKGRDDTSVVFRDGKVQDGWEMIGDDRPTDGFYFGFSTTHRVPTKANDSLVITLTAPKDLLGRGPYREGVLSAGVWQMTGSYSSIYGDRWNPIDYFVLSGEPPVAYMECWKGEWPIAITKAEGWKGTKSKNLVGLVERLTRSRGTTGHLCGSHA